MKRISTLISLIIIFFSSLAISQEPIPFSVGPYFSFKGGINGSNVQLGRKNAVSFYPVPDFGITGFLPLREDYSLGLSCDLGYSAYSFSLIDVDNDKKYDFHYGYLTISPNFQFLYFLIGFNFGYPLHADFGETINTDVMNLLAEFRLAATYPLLYDDEIAMNIFINAGYMLSGIYIDYSKHDPLKDLVKNPFPQKTTDLFNPRALTISLGLNYLFTLNPAQQIEE